MIKEDINNLDKSRLRDNIEMTYPLCYYNELKEDIKELNIPCDVSAYHIDPITDLFTRLKIKDVESITYLINQIGYYISVRIKTKDIIFE